ncbi:Disease resistance protein [Corchorus olitorius]|uniref:Disease resistance protein n=1 Tax=Corchorus olitorius TaxID=93759 RepID=A0A1R3HFM7_9ROSI|nr:Disease resistance protein [Corchorus olitorius]
MAEELVSSILLQLTTITIENAKQKVKLVTGVENEVEKLKSNFEAIQDVLEDAEEKQIVEKNVNRWLHKLKDVSYDIEDVLDEWNTAILKVRLQTNHGVESTSLPKKMVCPFISCFSFGHRVVKRHDIGIKIQGINEKLEEIAREKDRFQLTRREIRQSPRRLESTSVIDESKLLETKVFLVLDDVWEDHHGSWEELKDTFCHCKPGSRILVTTRINSVVRVMESSDVFPLEQLSDDICWSILRRVAFMGRVICDKDLEEIGMKIAQKCKGLPLAATTLGSLLREKESRAEWESILNSEIWRLDIAQEHIFKPLLLSYYDLPSTIRRCLLYCAFFPKDYVMSPNELILHWMVQGYLNFDEISEMEVKGKGYFNYLAGRSFFQDFQKDPYGGICSCKMHDVIHDFIQFLTKEEIMAEEVNLSESVSLNLSSQGARHLRITIGEGKRFPVSINGVGKLRSLLATGQTCDVNNEFLQGLFSEVRCLRLLEFGFGHRDMAARVKEIPEDIGKLIHLRYLNLQRSNKLRKLPKAICELQNLRYLNLRDCSSLEELPDEMEKLINLKYLYSAGCDRLAYYPKGIGKLSGLMGLDNVVARIDCNDARVFCVRDLQDLDMLSGELRLQIEGLDNKMQFVADFVEEAKRAKLHNKIHLSRLGLTLWLGGRFNLMQDTFEDYVIQALNPHTNLLVEWIRQDNQNRI